MVEETEQKQERPRPQLTPEQQASRQAAPRITNTLGERENDPRARVGSVTQVLDTQT